jgi:hypothetical protein
VRLPGYDARRMLVSTEEHPSDLVQPTTSSSRE